MTPSRALHYPGQDPGDCRNQMLPILGPASLPPPSPLFHSPLLYSNKSHRRHRKKYRPYRNKNYHRHNYDRYRYHLPIEYDHVDPEFDHQTSKYNADRFYYIRNRHEEARRRHASGSSSFQSASTFVDKMTRNNSFCSSCDEMETKSCQGSQCSCNQSYSVRDVEPIDRKMHTKIPTNSSVLGGNLHENSNDSNPPSLPPKMSQRYTVLKMMHLIYSEGLGTKTDNQFTAYVSYFLASIMSRKIM